MATASCRRGAHRQEMATRARSAYGVGKDLGHVANTVRTALEWFRKAAKAKAAWRRGVAPERERFLVTGRMRPLDRRKTLDAVETRLEGREPTPVVATQCIEACVDWDFDAMISECASWDALVQRMGRVNRRGERHDAECFILQAQRTFKGPDTGEKTCPVYREHEIRTAGWLEDGSPIRRAPGSMPEAPEDCVRPPTSAPVLTPDYLDLWSRNRADGPAFDVSVFLHGVRQERDVQVVWRDLDIARDRSFLKPLLKALPPSSLEAVSVPLRELRRWLGDRPAIRLGADVSIQSAEDIGVGATVVVPTEYGGIGGHGTFDGSADRVSDVSSAAMRDHRDLQFQLHDAPPVHDDESIEDQVESWIADDEARSILQGWRWIDIGRRWLFVSDLPIEDDDDGPTFRRRAVSLESHLNGVEARTGAVAERLGLPPEMTADLVLAARLHDMGKLDDRFQRLCGRTPDTGPLGKSGLDWVARRRREVVSDYPRGERHEALSVELMIRYGLHETANDGELVEHLVASHHGWARPFIRTAQGTARVHDRLFSLDFATELAYEEATRAPARFRSVQQRFGWLGLAWLEAVVQLCDHRQSEAEKRGEIGPAGGKPLDSRRSVAARTTPPAETALTAINGLIPGDYLAAVGVLRALDLADERALLRWEGTQPRFTTSLGVDEIVDRLVDIRKHFHGVWPAELNKLSGDQCNELLLTSEEPFRSLIVALVVAKAALTGAEGYLRPPAPTVETLLAVMRSRRSARLAPRRRRPRPPVAASRPPVRSVPPCRSRLLRSPSRDKPHSSVLSRKSPRLCPCCSWRPGGVCLRDPLMFSVKFVIQYIDIYMLMIHVDRNFLQEHRKSTHRSKVSVASNCPAASHICKSLL